MLTVRTRIARPAGLRWILPLAVAGALLWGSAKLQSPAQGAPAPNAALVEAARKEGTVVFYSAAPESVLDRLVKAFREKYPDIKAEYYRSSSAKVYERLTTELRANKVAADIFHASDPALIAELKKQHALMAYQSPEYRHYPAKYVDKDFTWFVARAHLLVISYNTRLVSGSDIPRQWKDLANPKFKGRVGILDPRSAGGGYYWQYTVYKLYGPQFFQEMARNEPKLFDGHGSINDRIISGELMVGVNLNYLVDASVLEKKAPIRAVYPEEGSPLILSPVGIVAKAPHPNAAKLFMDFLASPEGQDIFNSEYTYSLRQGATLKQGMKPLKEIKVMDLDIDDMIARQAEVTRAIRTAFGVQ